jgi:hypothetical protein
MPNDQGYFSDGGRYIREDDDRRYGGRRGSSFEDDDYSRRYSDGGSNRNYWNEGARAAQGRANYTYSGRDYEDTGEYRGGMAGEENRYGMQRWDSEQPRYNSGRYQNISRYGGRSGEESMGGARYSHNDMDKYRDRGYGDPRRFASDEDRDYYERRGDGGFIGGRKRSVRGVVRNVRNIFDDDDDNRRYANRGYERDWDNDNRSRNFERDDDYRYGRTRYSGRDHNNY